MTRISEHLGLLLGGDEWSGRRRAIDVPAELSRFQELMRPALEAAGAKMSIHAVASGVLRVEMRPETLHRILHMLVANSIEHLARSQKKAISIKATATEDTCEIVVADSGPGVAEPIAERIFEPLFSGKENGRGMGLAIARDLVELHGGRIVLVRRSGRRSGATFRISLPRKRSRATLPSG